jgi:signal transduction histidine kinase
MIHTYLAKVLAFLSFILFSISALATDGNTIVFSDTSKVLNIRGAAISILEDKAGGLTFQQVVKSDSFHPSQKAIPNLQVSASAFWLKFNFTNETNTEEILFDIAYPTIDSIDFYTVTSDSVYTKQSFGEYKKFSERTLQHPNYVVSAQIPKGATRTIYMRIRSGDQVMVPLSAGTSKEIAATLFTKDWIFGIYFGIIMVMALYNLFIFFSVRDRSYLYYVLYIVFVGLLQTSLHGYTFKYLWPNSPWMAMHGLFILTGLTPIAAVPFFRNFLQTKQFAPRYNKTLTVFVIIFAFCIILSLLNIYQLAFTLQQLCTMVMSFSLVWVGYRMARRGYRPAKFFLLAWSIFLAGVFIFILKDFGALPYNNFTFYMMPAGSALETILLSFALADKINTFRKEKEESQAQTLAAVEENARIVREQNVILEEKVTERTHELKESNDSLEQTLQDLKEAEMQLVESEKMASLGQLTAGIAHEINNPINFVTSNVKPLKRDVDIIINMLNDLEGITLSDGSLTDKQSKITALKEEYDFDYLKTEIDYLLKGINEGSSRTAEIVKGLRIFSRLDEDDLKKANINDGIDSTIIIVNNLLDNRIKIIRDFGNLPMAECYPGKLNQVFLNVITNGIHAIKSRFKESNGGEVTIKTHADENNIYVNIKDNGTGMEESTKKKLFEPFFTTKDVGEGTGLGLSIAWNTIKKHNGNIDVESILGQGTEFIITLPINHQN